MRVSRDFHKYLALVGLLFLAALLLDGCVKLVADYDAVTFEEILAAGKKVDKFYGDLLETNPQDRPYRKFSERYVDIETDIRSLVTRNKARALNDESTQISEITLKLWMKKKDNHKAKDTYSDGNAKLDRNQFERLFAAAASAEGAKKLQPGDTNPDKDSR